MENITERIINNPGLESSSIKMTLEGLHTVPFELNLCYSKRDFSVYWLGKSPRYFSTLQSENGNGSFQVLLHAKEMIKSTFRDLDDVDCQSDQFLKLMTVQYALDAQIEEMQRNLIVE